MLDVDFLISNKNRRIILFGTSDQNNLGDHAISIAEVQFIRERFPDNKLIEISKDRFYSTRQRLKKMIKKNDVVVITGGGFLGDLWMTEEQLVRDVINDYNDNPTIIMPQTIYFKAKSKEKLKSYDTYTSNSRLSICVRDKNSYNLIRKDIPNFENLFLFPDMVLALKSSPGRNREGVVLCLRLDLEKNINESDVQFIKDEILKRGFNYKCTSTLTKSRVPILVRKFFLDKKLREFSGAKLVITDRLHGMIFAAITGTPCIAFDNLSHKVSGVYEWIQSLDYIQCIDSVHKIPEAIDKVLSNKECQYDNDFLEKYFNELANLINRLLTEKFD